MAHPSPAVGRSGRRRGEALSRAQWSVQQGIDDRRQLLRRDAPAFGPRDLAVLVDDEERGRADDVAETVVGLVVPAPGDREAELLLLRMLGEFGLILVDAHGDELEAAAL